MRRISLYFLALLMGCGTIEPGNNNINPCIGNSCGDSFQSDSQVSSTDSGNKDDVKSVDSTDILYTDPNTMPLACKPNNSQTTSCYNNTCTSWYHMGEACLKDTDCQKLPSAEEAEKKAAGGICKLNAGECVNNHCTETSPWKNKPSCQTNDDCSAKQCHGGWDEYNLCGADIDCQNNPITPYVCWNFCDLIGMWKSEQGGPTFHIKNFGDNTSTCDFKESLSGNIYKNVPGTSVMSTTTSDGIKIELVFVPYCQVGQSIFDCSVKQDCRMDNHCAGSCSGQSCNTDDDCKAIQDFAGCKQSTCTSTGEKCHVTHSTDPDPCPIIYAPCQTDNKYLLMKECNNNKCVTSMLKKIY